MGKVIQEISKLNKAYDTHEIKGFELKECYLVTKLLNDDNTEVVYAIKEKEVQTSF